jgi:hypothetical protein
MTKIAKTHQTRSSSQDCRAESAPENIGEKKHPEIASFDYPGMGAPRRA